MSAGFCSDAGAAPLSASIDAADAEADAEAEAEAEEAEAEGSLSHRLVSGENT